MTAINWRVVQSRLGALVDGQPGRQTWGKLLALAVDRPVDDGLKRVAQGLAKFAPQYPIGTPNSAAEFIAETAHETGGFKRWEENLSYSAQRMAEVWPGRYAVNPSAKVKTPNAKAKALAFRPKALAIDTYGARMGNLPAAKDTDSDPDGWQYRGRGPTMLTGRAAYEAAGPRVGLDLVKFPDLAADPFTGVLIALEFYQRRGVFAAAERGDFKAAREAVNGGTIGLAAVAAIRAQLLKVLAA